MEKFMKPQRLSLNPNKAIAELKFNHWHRALENFLSKMDVKRYEGKFPILINFSSADVYNYMSVACNFHNAIEILQTLYAKR